MFLGHYGVALGAKRLAPKTSLGTLILAAQLADLLWPILLLLGIEHVRIVHAQVPTLNLDFVSYPITHSLLTGILGGLLLGTLYSLLRKGKDMRGAFVVAALVPSHWILDFLVHVPDLPLWPGGPRVGLGLWRSLPWTLVVEAFFLIAGLVIYLRTTRAKDGVGNYALWSLVVLLVTAYLGALVGPAPRNTQALAYSALILWLLVPWAYWIDRHRTLRNPGIDATSA
ncbi:MAG TPA: hypothetical protein VMU62_10165 [Acidobacteriaceae bacterium]|nr:hypothetical protein [Acidobacteriaceae bacterium]